MPKYNPTPEDMYSTKPCAVCGRDVIFDDEETCCDMCKMNWESFKEDFEWMRMRELEEENPDENLSGW